jgi:hypothetical protein
VVEVGLHDVTAQFWFKAKLNAAIAAVFIALEVPTTGAMGPVT